MPLSMLAVAAALQAASAVPNSAAVQAAAMMPAANCLDNADGIGAGRWCWRPTGRSVRPLGRPRGVTAGVWRGSNAWGSWWLRCQVETLSPLFPQAVRKEGLC